MAASHLPPIILIIIFFIISFHTTLNFLSNSNSNSSLFHHPITTNTNLILHFRFLHAVPSPIPHFAPAPAPAPSVSPASAPLHPHRDSHPWKHRPLPEPPHRTDRGAKGVNRTVLAAAVSFGILVVGLLCGVGLILRRRRVGRRKVPRKYAGSQVIKKKVLSELGPDLFYLDSIESALETEKCCLQKIGSSNGDEEIAAVDEDSPEAVDGSDSSIGDRITPVQTNRRTDSSSSSESFHSFSESQNSQLRLSNASSCDNSDALWKDVGPEATAIPPPPPPPPPPPLLTCPIPRAPILTKTTYNVLKSSTMSSSTAVTIIPPPPCPPEGQSSFLKPPPPPPPPLGKDGSPLPKLKPLHWDKVRAAPNRMTVWDKLRSSSFEFDEEMIESLFGYNINNNSTKHDESKSKTPSPDKHVLDHKRLQNLIILSKALNVTEDQVCTALIRGDGLSLQDLEALSKMAPTKDEEAKISDYKGDVFELSSAEKLVKAMLKIPFAFSRIEAMLYRETFEDEVLHLRKSFSMLEEACKELRSSRLFLKLLEAVLKTGNRMNIGTIRGGAKAFKLDALLKLADIKGTDGRTTLLHFVVLEIIRSEGLRVSESIMGKIHQRSTSSSSNMEENYRTMGLDLVSGLSTELCNVKKTATIDLDVLASSVTNLSDAMSRSQHLVEKDMVTEEDNGSFVGSMRSFLTYAESKLRELQEDENRVLLQVREITEYFHGDKSKDESSNPLRIFVIVRDFLSMLDHVCKELKSSKGPRGPNPLAPAFR